MYQYLKGLLVAKAAAGEPVIVILDAFERFALENNNSKQLLLYNVLDWLQVRRLNCLGLPSRGL